MIDILPHASKENFSAHTRNLLLNVQNLIVACNSLGFRIDIPQLYEWMASTQPENTHIFCLFPVMVMLKVILCPVISPP